MREIEPSCIVEVSGTSYGRLASFAWREPWHGYHLTGQRANEIVHYKVFSDNSQSYYDSIPEFWP